MKASIIFCLLVTLALYILPTSAQDDPEECPGCPVLVDPSDPQMRKYAQYIVDEMQKEHNCTGLEGIGFEGCSYALEWIVNVTSQQVLDGLHLNFDIRVQHLETTPEAAWLQHLNCIADVVVTEDSEQILNRTCQVLKFCPGCSENVHHGSAEIIKHAVDVVQEIQAQANCTCTYTLENIVHARREIFDGETLYYILHVRYHEENGDEVTVQDMECLARVHISMWRETEQITLLGCIPYDEEP